MMLWIGVLVSVVLGRGEAASDQCHTTDRNPYIFYASKTSYELINNEDSSAIVVSGCKPVLFWMVARHGARYPPADQVTLMKNRLPNMRKNILQNHKDKRGSLCQQDIDALANNGSLRIDENSNEALTSTGREELLLLGRRYRGRFPAFFNVTYKPKDYQFRHIASASSQASARSFSRGIFPGIDVALTEAAPGDELVQFYENCTRWSELVDRRQESDQVLSSFHQSQTFLRTLDDVAKRLGFPYGMSSEDMLLVYDICRYQKAWNLEQASSWCSAFSTDNLKVLEYAEDLKTYYKQGYGFQLNYKQACPLLQDLITRIRSVHDNGTAESVRGLFYFTEGEGLLRLMALLGVAKDDRPLTDQITEFADRKWRTSLIGSFAANVVVVLYNCSGEYKVQLFVKEEVVRLEKCPERSCTLQQFLSIFGKMADECSRQDICENGSTSLPASSLLSLLTIVYLLMKSN